MKGDTVLDDKTQIPNNPEITDNNSDDVNCDRDDITTLETNNDEISDEANQTDETNEEETPNQKKKKRLSTIVEYVELFTVSVLVVLFVFSFMFRMCVVDGSSMNNTLQDGERLITRDFFYTPKCGDIIVFYEGEPYNKPLVKRVIATGGQTITIDYNNGNVSVDGEILNEDYIFLSGDKYFLYYGYTYDEQTKIMTVTVPEGQLFVMGDNRNDSVDSRTSSIGCISEEQVMGKVILRISPFTVFN